MEIIAAQDLPLLAWAQHQLDTSWVPSQVRWLSGIEAERPAFVVVYSHFSERDCHLSIATDQRCRWASRVTLRAILHVPFRQWSLRRVTAVTRVDNVRALDMLRRLGFQQEGVARCAFPGDVDGVVMGLLREEAERWLR